MSDPLADLSRQIADIAKTLQGISQDGGVSKRNANTLADAVIAKSCPVGLVGCNAKVLGEVTGNVLTCPPLDEAPDPIIVDHKARVCYAPESLRKQFAGKKVDLKDLMDKYATKLLNLLSKQGNLANAMRAAVAGSTSRVAVTNVYTSSNSVGVAAVSLGIDISEAATYLSMFSDKVSMQGAEQIINAVSSTSSDVLTWFLALSMAYSLEQKRDFVDAMDALGEVLAPGDLSFLDTGFVAAMGGGNTASFVLSSMEALVVDAYATGPKSGYFVAIQAAYEAYKRVALADSILARAISGEFFSGGGPTQPQEDASRALQGEKLNWLAKGVEIAKAVRKTLDPVRRASACEELGRIQSSQSGTFEKTYAKFKGLACGGGFPAGVINWVTRQFALDAARGAPRSFIAAVANPVASVVANVAAPAVGVLGSIFDGLRVAASGVSGVFSGGDDSMWGGDVNDYEAMRAFLEGGGMVLEGGALPQNIHTAPGIVQDALSEQHPKTDQERALKKKLALLGREITVYKTDTCPSFVSDDNNSFGTAGQRGWVETKHPWAKCQEQMGFQFQTNDGYCYPTGMSCYPQHDIKGALAKTQYEALNYQEMAKIYNSVVQEEYNTWLVAEKARIRNEPQNFGRITEKEVDEIAKSHTPAEFEGIPDAVAVQTMVTISKELEQKVSELTTSTDSKQRQILKDIIVKYGSMKAQWSDKDLGKQTTKLDAITKQYVEEAEKCTAKSIVENDRTIPVVVAAAGCEVLELGNQKLLIPAQIKARIDESAIAKGEPVDPLVEWWRSYYASKEHEHKKKFSKLREQLAPELGRAESATAKRLSDGLSLERGLKAALSPHAPRPTY